MSKFIAYELAPATEMSGEVMAHDDEASAKAIACDYFWSLYGRNHDQTVTCIGDFQTYDFAAERNIEGEVLSVRPLDVGGA